MVDQQRPSGAVFLSYASEDAGAATRICDALRAVDIDVWLDKNELRGGDAWDAQIRKRIHDCALFIPVISANTNARSEGYFRREWKQATRRLQDMADDVAFLVPVVVDETREADARVPEEFLSAQWTWLRDGETPPAFAERVRQLLASNRASVAIDRPLVNPTQSRERTALAPASRWRRVGLALATLAVVGIIGGLWWRYAREAGVSVTSHEGGSALASVVAAADEKSIAVLPFEDMSPDKNQAYMADGISEELINQLAQIPDLKVIARTSSFAFKDQKLQIDEIAEKLNVAHVLEGSVRTSGDRLRITAQLVRAADSRPLWSKTFDRNIEDIFTVQSEIAGAIAEVMQIRLMGGALNRPEGGTQNLEAYQLYLRAWNAEDWSSKGSLDAVSDMLERVTQLDPEFGRAWAARASAYRIKVENGYLSATEGMEPARTMALRAVQLSPRSADAHAQLATVYYVYDWDWNAAESEFKRALELDPTNPSVLVNAARLAMTRGQWQEAESKLRGALDRDPLNYYATYNLGGVYYRSGQLEKAETTLRHLLELSPDFPWTRSMLGAVLVARGKPEDAIATVQQDADEAWRLTILPIALEAASRRLEADDALKAQIAMWSEKGAYFVAQSYAYRNDNDRAMDWLERAYKQKDIGLVDITGEPLLKSLAADARFKAFLRKMNLPG